MVYKLHKNEIPKAGSILADAFQNDSLWNKIIEDGPNRENKFQACFETSIRYCYQFGEVYASSENLEGIAGWVSGQAPEMNFWSMLQSGAIFPAIRMGANVLKKMGPIFKPLLKDRHENMKGKPYIYLFVIGVAAKHQGRGFGGKIMRVLIEKCEKQGIHLYLETESERNVEMYKRYGCKVIKQITLPLVDRPMWEMMRETRVYN